MWRKTRKTNALLAPLAPLVESEPSDGRLKGVYQGHAVEAWPDSGYPIGYLTSNIEGGVGPAPVNMLKVTLAGISGYQTWHCQSSASGQLHDLASRFTSGQLLTHFKPGQFEFEGADPMNEATERMGEKLVKRLGIALKSNADPALQERLIAAGLFTELDALRLGGHPYLPKVEFIPGSAELSAQFYLKSAAFARRRPAVEERLRAAGIPDFETAVERMQEHDAKFTGRLELAVEAGDARVPSPGQFREVLEHALRIAQINADVNRPDA